MFCFCAATAEPGDEEAVTRAKYFIRDEFLVSIAPVIKIINIDFKLCSAVYDKFRCCGLPFMNPGHPK